MMSARSERTRLPHSMRPLLAMLLLFSGCPDKAPTAKVRPPPLVVAAPVEVVDVPVLVRAPVDVRPIVSADVGSKTVGYLDAVLVDRGDVVKKGQLLALVRPSELPDQLLSAKSAVSQAQASSALAKANLERAQALAPRGLVSQQELQNATNAAAVQRGAAGRRRRRSSGCTPPGWGRRGWRRPSRAWW